MNAKQIAYNAIAYNAIHTHGAIQKEGELVRLIELVSERNPSIIVEIGCYRGGMLYVWQQLAEQIYGIDSGKGYYNEVPYLNTHGAMVILASSHLKSTKDRLTELLPNLCDILFIDGDHSENGVKQDVKMYLPFIRQGGLLVMHDIIDVEIQKGPSTVWNELEGNKLEIIEKPLTWGGIGIMEVGK